MLTERIPTYSDTGTNYNSITRAKPSTCSQGLSRIRW